MPVLEAQMSYVHIAGHTTFVSLQFFSEKILWTYHLCAVKHWLSHLGEIVVFVRYIFNVFYKYADICLICRHGTVNFIELWPTISALEALRNVLYKFKTYLLTYLLTYNQHRLCLRTACSSHNTGT